MLKNFKKAQKSVSVIRDQTLFMDVMLLFSQWNAEGLTNTFKDLL